jgi:two-component system chemotaxis response regulator CheB
MENVSPRHDIIVIGASLGGVKALQTLVRGLPDDLAASLFLVMHILASQSSHLPIILRRLTSLSVLQAAENMVIEQRKIYVAPPDHHLLLEEGYMHLGTGPKEQYVRPSVNVLFRSAAHAYGPRVVGIILTGGGQDGAAGLQVVKLHGGMTIVQDPENADFPSMPQSALKHVKVDYTMPLLSIAPLLTRLVQPVS